MTNKMRDLVCSVIMIVFGGGMLIMAKDIPHKIESDVGSGYVPTFIAICILIVAVAKLVLTLINKKPSGKQKMEPLGDWFGGISTILLMAAYMIAFDKLGFVIASAIYLFVQMLILSNEKNRNLILFAAIAVILPLAVDALFVFAIKMPLPRGLWGF